MNAPVFISYSTKDKEAAENICAELEKRELKCWISARDIEGGDNYQEAIVRAIRAAKVIVLVFTENANNSDEIKNEVALASQHQLVVIPVRVHNLAPNDALAYALATRQWIDLFPDRQRGIERLSSRVAAIASIPIESTTPQTSQHGIASGQSVIPEFNADQWHHRTADLDSHIQSQTSAVRPLVKPRRFGLIRNMIVGCVGAVIAGYLLPQLGIYIGGGLIGAIINAFIGAMILLFILRLIKR
jgi:uncharacterized membrane protein YeaQ/YmgE (transglycosylase-associated protein family)